MSTILHTDTQMLIQGITGQEGQKACAWMMHAGSRVVAGVTPGKGGQEVDGISVYSTVKEALKAHPHISLTSIYAPPQFVRSAALEAIEAGIPIIHIIAEEVSLADSAFIIAKARQKGVLIIGPSSIGVISPGIGKVGSIGGPTNDQFTKGPVGLISKSGGLCSEFSMMFTRHGIGQSTVIGIGGNKLIGTTYADLFPFFEKDDDTKVVVLIGELGGTYEEEAAQAIKDRVLTKPVVAFISGIFAQTLPNGVSFGHAGAIVDAHIGRRENKIQKLSEAGVHIADSPEDVVTILKGVLA